MTDLANATTTLSEREIADLAVDWYHKLDVHADFAELLPMVADHGLEMRFPEGTMRGREAFKAWYDTVTRRFFDEIHTVKDVSAQISGDRADVKVVVNWQAKIWDPPEPTSRWLGFNAYQTWVVERSPTTRQPVVVSYVVDALEPMEGSASL